MVRLHIHPRATDFANNVYYVFHNAVSVNNSLSSGVGQSTKGAINMEIAGTYSSSENWQLYYQQGRYFIRNYDYAGQWQLGLTEDSPVIPKLMKRSGALGQQWTMERQDDGTYKFHNGLLGNTSALALTKGNKQPAMQSAESGSKWEITPNPSALAPKDTTMMLDNDDFEIPKVSSSSTALSSTQTQTSTATTPATITTSTSASQTTNTNLASNSSPTNSALPAPKSSSLAPGAIAGIAIGIVLIIALVGGISYLVWSRRKPKADGPPTAELGDTNKAYYQYAHMGQPQNASAYAPYGGPPAQLDSPPVMHELEHAPVEKAHRMG